MNGQTRAQKGGEVASNGEFYEGGKFLPSTTLPKRESKQRPKRTGRVLVEPGVLETPPDGRGAIFAAIREFVQVKDGRLEVTRAPDHSAHSYYFAGGYTELKALAERYNAGDRFI